MRLRRFRLKKRIGATLRLALGGPVEAPSRAALPSRIPSAQGPSRPSQPENTRHAPRNRASSAPWWRGSNPDKLQKKKTGKKCAESAMPIRRAPWPKRSEVDREMSLHYVGVVVQQEFWPLTQGFWFGGFRAGRGRQKGLHPDGVWVCRCAHRPARVSPGGWGSRGRYSARARGRDARGAGRLCVMRGSGRSTRGRLRGRDESRRV